MENNTMTIMSGRLYDLALKPGLTPDSVMQILEENAAPRVLWQTLARFYDGSAPMENVIRDGLYTHLLCRAAYTKETPTDNEKEKLRSRVSKWKSGGTRTIDKATAIELCFIFRLTWPRANEFVTRLAEEGFHCRDTQELLYVYALRNGLSYEKAYAFIQEFSAFTDNDQNPKSIADLKLTSWIAAEFDKVKTEEELSDFLEKHKDAFGTFHNQAFLFFTQALETLTRESQKENALISQFIDQELKEPRCFVRTILKDRLMSDDVKAARRRSREKNDSFVLTELEKIISSCWPDDSHISQMKTRKADVSRKAVILLFMASLKDPFEMPVDEAFWDMDPEWDEEAENNFNYFAKYYQDLNDMLNRCGFSALDPRSPFDWIIIYILNAGDTFDVDHRYLEVFKSMFDCEEREKQ